MSGFQVPTGFKLSTPEIYEDDHYNEDIDDVYSIQELYDGFRLKLECVDIVAETYSNFKFKKADAERPEWDIKDSIIDIVCDILLKLYPIQLNREHMRKCIELDVEFKSRGDIITGPSFIEKVNIKSIEVNEKEFVK